MNRRHLLNSATCLIPGASFLQGTTKAAASLPAGDPGVSCFGEEEAILAARNTEEVVMELLHICLERIDWQGDVSEWKSRFWQIIDRMQLALQGCDHKSETMGVTAHQMNAITNLCEGAQAGSKEEIIGSLLRFGDAFNIRLTP